MSEQILHPTASQQKKMLAPGLLPVLQTLVALRFALPLLGAIALALVLSFGDSTGPQPPVAAFWMVALFLIESASLLIFVLWPAVRQRLGSAFLPIALGWLLLAPQVLNLLFVLAFTPRFTSVSGPDPFTSIGIESIWLAAPVFLAAWQYGRKGWLWSVAVLIVSTAILGPFASGHDFYEAMRYWMVSLARVGTITLLGWVVMRLASSLQAEQRSLLAANRRLAQRAATIEQLAESRERNRLARELHDTLAHSLTGVSVQLQALATLMQHDHEAAEAQLRETQATVRSGIKESRRAIEALRASPLEDLGLSEALRQLCRKSGERTGFVFDCEIADVPALDPLTEQAIYRVAEAALTNVVQHAAASKAQVRLQAKPALVLEIQDNGIGFDPGAIPDDRYGLTGMAERAELVGAQLTVESESGQGTKVKMKIRDREAA